MPKIPRHLKQSVNQVRNIVDFDLKGPVEKGVAEGLFGIICPSEEELKRQHQPEEMIEAIAIYAAKQKIPDKQRIALWNGFADLTKWDVNESTIDDSGLKDIENALQAVYNKAGWDAVFSIRASLTNSKYQQLSEDGEWIFPPVAGPFFTLRWTLSK